MYGAGAALNVANLVPPSSAPGQGLSALVQSQKPQFVMLSRSCWRPSGIAQLVPCTNFKQRNAKAPLPLSLLPLPSPPTQISTQARAAPAGPNQAKVPAAHLFPCVPDADSPIHRAGRKHSLFCGRPLQVLHRRLVPLVRAAHRPLACNTTRPAAVLAQGSVDGSSAPLPAWPYCLIKIRGLKYDQTSS
jgi:hypothetical protein